MKTAQDIRKLAMSFILSAQSELRLLDDTNQIGIQVSLENLRKAIQLLNDTEIKQSEENEFVINN